MPEVRITLGPEEAGRYADYLAEAGKWASAAFVRREIARVLAADGPGVVVEIAMRPDAEVSN